MQAQLCHGTEKCSFGMCDIIMPIQSQKYGFCSFLTKLCDQVAVLISEEYGGRLTFKSRNADSIKESVPFGHSGRLLEFEVEQTTQQEETAAASGGIEVH